MSLCCRESLLTTCRRDCPCMLLTLGAMANMAWGTDGTRSFAFVMWFTFYHLVISMIVNLVCDFFCCKGFVSFCCWLDLDSCRRFVLTLDLSRWSWPYVCVVKTKSCEMNSFVHVVDNGCHVEYGMRDGWNEEPCICNVIYFLSSCDFYDCESGVWLLLL